MSKRWSGIVLFIVMVWGLSAFAGPQIGIGDPDCSSWNKYASTYGAITDVKAGDTLTITPNKNGGGFFGFCNSTGNDWTSIDIKFYTTTLQPPDALHPDWGVNCTADIFQFCDQSKDGNIYDLFFHGVDGSYKGVRHDFLMTVNLFTNCDPSADTEATTCQDDGTGGWRGITLLGGANENAPIPQAPAVPEPATIALVGSGAMAVWRRRKKRS